MLLTSVLEDYTGIRFGEEHEEVEKCFNLQEIKMKKNNNSILIKLYCRKIVVAFSSVKDETFLKFFLDIDGANKYSEHFKRA